MLCEDFGCLFLFEFAYAPPANLSPLKETRNVAFTVFFFSFLVFILHALFFGHFPLFSCGYFGCIAVCASLVDGAIGWLLDVVRTWYPSLEEESGLYGFSCDCSFVGKIAWH